MRKSEIQDLLNDTSLLNEPATLAGGARTPTVSQDEARERRVMMSSALAQGLGQDQIIGLFAAKYSMTETGVKALMREVRKQWKEEDAELAEHSRAAARRRIQTHISRAAAAGKWSAVASLESVLSEVEGTVAPEPVGNSDDLLNRVSNALMAQMQLTDPATIRVMIDRERILIEKGGVVDQPTDVRPKSSVLARQNEIDVSGESV